MLTLFGDRSTPVLPHWHVKKKNPGHSAKMAIPKWQITPGHAYTVDQRSRSGLTMLSRHSVETYRGNELTRSSTRNALPQSFQIA